MWFLAILVLLNAWANNTEFVNTYRVYIFGMPANAIDGCVVLGVLVSLIYPQVSPKFHRTERMHPAVIWMLGLFALATLGGMIGASHNGASTRQIMTALRNFLTAPAALYLAYFLTANIKSSRWFLYISVLAGAVVSFMIVVFFKEKTEMRTFGELNQVRAVAYMSAYAGLAAALLFYSLSAGLRLLPLLIAWVVMGACLVGQFTTLSRSDWLACAGAFGAAILLLPKNQRMKSFFRAALAVPILVGSLWIGMYAGSKVSGKNLFQRFQDRVLSMLPGDQESQKIKGKAWDTRLPGTFQELRLFASSPLIGGGFAIQDTPAAEAAIGLRHNSWSATLAETGIIGFSAFAIMVGSMIVVGRRMVRERTDQTTVLIGAMGVMTAFFYILHGLATMSFNQIRPGLTMFVTAGVLLRTRQVQLALMRQAHEEQAYLEQHAETYDSSIEPHDGVGPQEPAFGGGGGGNWYQTN